jgi:tetratricopeptide (TPR) repeat protein
MLMRASLFLASAALFLATGASAASAPTPDPAASTDKPIIVTGTSLRQSERNLKECLARHCPPNEDIDATLAHAENLFVAGDYKQARSTTLASIGRNSKFSKQYPVDVSDLYRANGRIAAHLGEGHDYEFSTAEMRRILSGSFGHKDTRVISAELEVASMYAALGRTDRAKQLYEEAERDAKAIGRDDLAGVVRVRAAWLHQIEGDNWLTRQALQKIADDRSESNRTARLTALILLGRLDRIEKKPESTDALLAELRTHPGKIPALLFAPRIEAGAPRLVDPEHQAMTALSLMPTSNFENQWVDIGFWVTPDGKVSDPEILRSRGDIGWAQPLLRSVAGRIYSPISDPDGTYRVERYTWTSLWEYDRTGTHMRMRSADGRIEYLDLTAEPKTASR